MSTNWFNRRIAWGAFRGGIVGPRGAPREGRETFGKRGGPGIVWREPGAGRGGGGGADFPRVCTFGFLGGGPIKKA